MTTYTTETLTGKTLKLEINYSKKIEEVEHNFDGDVVTFEEVKERAEVKAYLDGQFLGTGDYLYVSKIEGSAYEGRVPAEITNFVLIGNKPVALTAEQANELNKIFEEIKSAGKSEEVREIEQTEVREEIEEAKEILRVAENQKTIPTKAEAAKIRENYNNLYNEGKEGYIPHIVDVEEYNWALKILNK